MNIGQPCSLAAAPRAVPRVPLCVGRLTMRSCAIVPCPVPWCLNYISSTPAWTQPLLTTISTLPFLHPHPLFRHISYPKASSPSLPHLNVVARCKTETCSGFATRINSTPPKSRLRSISIAQDEDSFLLAIHIASNPGHPRLFRLFRNSRHVLGRR